MATILLVDDRAENLLALEAILEPLEQNLVLAGSGPDALKSLMRHDDVAVILLDVQMPDMSGFETATLVKTRKRTQRIPIIFLTGLSDDVENRLAGYSIGAVDYLVKPFDSTVLLSKVSVFVELYEQREEVGRQAALLRAREVAELRRTQEARYRNLTEAIPQVVWTSDSLSGAQYFNSTWYELTGLKERDSLGMGWLSAVHVDDRARVKAAWEEAESGQATGEFELRIVTKNGRFCWHLGRILPMTESEGGGSVGTFTDISAQKELFEERDEIASVLQRSLLPSALPALDFMDAGLGYRPAGHGIGGDFYDLFVRQDGSVVVLVGDVSGKGVEAATITGVARHTLRAGAFSGLGPAALLVMLNETLLRNEYSRFLSAACAVITPQADDGLHLTLASGGHPPPIMVLPDGQTQELIVDGILVGILEEQEFAELDVEVPTGSYVAFFTDGVPEARNDDGEMFGEQRIFDLLAQSIREHQDAQTAADALLEGAVQWQPGKPYDDTAVLIVCAGAKRVEDGPDTA